MDTSEWNRRQNGPKVLENTWIQLVLVLLCSIQVVPALPYSTHHVTSSNKLDLDVTTGSNYKLQNYHNVSSDLGGRRRNNNILKLGFLCPYSPGDNLMRGAVPEAVADVNKDGELLPAYVLDYIYRESGNPGTADAIRAMTRMKDEGVDVFIGPDENCMSEGLVATAWDIPMISYKCLDQRVSDKALYPTFARTRSPSSKVSKFLISLLTHFKWNKIVIILSTKPSWQQIADAVRDLVKDHNITITSVISLPANHSSSNIESAVKTTLATTRIYVLIGDNDMLVDFARQMYQEQAVKEGKYVIISVDDETRTHTDADASKQYIMKEYEKHGNITDTMINAFQSVLILTPLSPVDTNEYKKFLERVKNRSIGEPFRVPYPRLAKLSGFFKVPIYAAHAYDAVMIYAKAVTKLLKKSTNPRNTSEIMKNILGQAYDKIERHPQLPYIADEVIKMFQQGIQGFRVQMDKRGDAEGNYTVLALLQALGPFEPKRMARVAQFDMISSDNLPVYRETNAIDWVSGSAPPSEPECGFEDDKCEKLGLKMQNWIIVIIAVVCVIITIPGIFIFRYYTYEHKLACLLWKIDMKDIQNINDASESANKKGYRLSQKCENVSDLKKTFTETGCYKGTILAVKRINKRNFDLTRAIRKELKQIREMRHDNINMFVGACIDPPNVSILTIYCARGSLKDILSNGDLDLDNMFVASLVADLLKGIIYLHESEIVSHGNLTSSNCVVDSRWVLQITGFGLHEFKAGQDGRNGHGQFHKGLLWRAPELLRCPNAPARGTQKGDVYSFGIILYEIIGRKGPWGPMKLSEHDIVQRVMRRNCHPEFRPPTSILEDCPDYILRCMKDCWVEDENQRPDFRTVRVSLKEIQAGLKPNIFDNMMAIMEKYAYNLEGIVEERTNQLMEEKKKTEALLHRMLPRSVADDLKRGNRVKAESFDCVTIYFSDIVGFTTLSAESTPLQVVDLLNDLYTCFDSIIEDFEVYKVETIGDAYMVVSGLPETNGDNHAGHIASMALSLLKAIRNFKIKHLPGECLKLRIGIHSGPCVAGVVGLKMPRYCLFGDTVNTASRMESTGEALKIHVSEACKVILDKIGGYKLTERGLILVKGKGEMRTFWLDGQEGNSPAATPKTDFPVVKSPVMYNEVESVSIDDDVNFTEETSVTFPLLEAHRLVVKTNELNIGKSKAAPHTYKVTPNGNYCSYSSVMRDAKIGYQNGHTFRDSGCHSTPAIRPCNEHCV